jgi:hypothetical protein
VAGLKTKHTRRNFMDGCKALAAMVCESRAIDQKIGDDTKASFVKQCVKDQVGR